MAERSKSFRLSRDGILFFVGLAGIVYETLVNNGDKPTLLVLFGAMVGLPAFLRTDESKQKVIEKIIEVTKKDDPPEGVEKPAPEKDPL